MKGEEVRFLLRSKKIQSLHKLSDPIGCVLRHLESRAKRYKQLSVDGAVHNSEMLPVVDVQLCHL